MIFIMKMKDFLNLPKNDIYSSGYRKLVPDDMTEKKLRPDCKICLFNNTYVWKDKYHQHMNQIDEIQKLW